MLFLEEWYEGFYDDSPPILMKGSHSIFVDIKIQFWQIMQNIERELAKKQEQNE